MTFHQDYGAIVPTTTDEEEVDDPANHPHPTAPWQFADLAPSYYQSERVPLVSSSKYQGEGQVVVRNERVPEEDNYPTNTHHVWQSRHCNLVSSFLLLALMSFVGSVGWFVVMGGGGEGEGTSWWKGGTEKVEASLMNQQEQHDWARNPMQRWAHMSKPNPHSDGVYAQDSHGNQIKTVTVIVVKDHDGKNESCDHGDDDCQKSEQCHPHEKCSEEKSKTPVPAPVALPPKPAMAVGAPVPFLDSHCSAVADCAHLTGACCPTEQGVFLECCGETKSATSASPVTKTPSTAPVPPPTEAHKPKLAACAAFPACAGLHLMGNCCPTTDGIFLDCCGQVELETTFPTSLPPSQHPTNIVLTIPLPTDGPTGRDSSCAAYSVCSDDLQLTGDCCPTVDHIYLECCFETPNPSLSPTQGPTPFAKSGEAVESTAVPTDPTCASHWACAHLQGDCCPTMEGLVLDCCSVPEPTTAPTTFPSVVPTETPTNAPSTSPPTLVPSEIPTLFPTFEPTLSPTLDPASCAAHPACADLHGDCCPTRHSHRYLKCCSVDIPTTDMPSPSPLQTTPTVAPLAATVGSPTSATYIPETEAPNVVPEPESEGKGSGKGRIPISVTSHDHESKTSKAKYAKASKTVGSPKQAKAKLGGPKSAKWAKAASKKGRKSKKTSKW